MADKNHLKRHQPTNLPTYQVASGKWQVASGKWQVASGKHIIAANPGYHAMLVLEACPLPHHAPYIHQPHSTYPSIHHPMN
ncbi:hypothetical protein ADT32_07125 [Xylella fastidiosa]|uniref:hypothetical protein n=1 Tax=Xylella fastidiosa TaxID=2371 RepID=UPI000765D4B6|nr:hypothetical protein [Xylella fastidiosa]KXB10963.1 hypothetical protein ADT32_07125 [Xylella fastidiosa]